MTPAETLTLAAYFFVLIILAIYGWHRYYLVYLYMRNRDKEPKPGPPLDPLPVVTIQLPLYNEMYVADRLIEAVCRIDYPRELLEIQVLDDSTDETRSIAELAVRRFAAQGIDIKYFHRADRTGYKAGALEAGLKVARGEFIAIFDADFIPTAGLPHQPDAALPRPEGRDGAGALGPHQPGLLAADEDPGDPARRPLHPRARRPQPRRPLLQLQRHRRHLAPRRRSTMRAAGSTTRSPRISISATARSCAAGSSCSCPDVIAPAEVPVEMNAFKSQQHRWAKGSIQTCRKLLPRILRVEPAARRQGRGVLPPDRELQLHPDVHAVGADVPVHGDPLQHGLVRDDAHRRAAVLRGDVLVLQLLHGLPARDPQGLARAARSTCRS